jgi:hypothetical protein
VCLISNVIKVSMSDTKMEISLEIVKGIYLPCD